MIIVGADIIVRLEVQHSELYLNLKDNFLKLIIVELIHKYSLCTVKIPCSPGMYRVSLLTCHKHVRCLVHNF